MIVVAGRRASRSPCASVRVLDMSRSCGVRLDRLDDLAKHPPPNAAIGNEAHGWGFRTSVQWLCGLLLMSRVLW